ncbi:MAG: pilus assembly protein [Chloroflexi bacterium]|nr:pilus assembly protein [Chloroflexota bacterium]
MAGCRRAGRLGQSAVELALWLPLLLVLLLGAIEVGSLIRAQTQLHAVAREAARAAALAPDATRALTAGEAAGRLVADEYGLPPAPELTIAVTLVDGVFGWGTTVETTVLLRRPLLTQRSTQRERVDCYRTFAGVAGPVPNACLAP